MCHFFFAHNHKINWPLLIRDLIYEVLNGVKISKRSEIGYICKLLKLIQLSISGFLCLECPAPVPQDNHVAHSLTLGALLECHSIGQGNKYKADGGEVFSIPVSGTPVLSIGLHSRLNTWPPTSPRLGKKKAH